MKARRYGSALRIAAVVLFAGLTITAWSHPALREGSLAGVRGRLAEARAFAAQRPLLAGAEFFCIYVGISLLAIFPVAILMALLAGAVFGLWTGTLLVCAASSVGATLTFGLARAIGRDWIQRRFQERLRGLDHEVARDGAYYVFLLRLTPVVPFSVVNIGMALTPIPAAKFLTASFLGMLPASAAFVNAGRELAAIRTPSDVASPALIGSLFVIGALPITIKKFLGKRV